MSDKIRKPPEVIKSEEALLSQVLSDPSIVHDIYSELKPKHFFRESHRYIWGAIEACVQDGHDPTYMAILSKLDEYDADESIDADRLDELHTELPDRQAAEHHAEVIREFYRRRLMQRTCDEVAGRLEDFEMDYEEARKLIADKTQEASGDDSGEQIYEVAEQVQQDIEQMQRDDTDPYYPTDIEVVDEVLGGGLYKSRFYLLAARPKHGKTSLAIAIACRLADRHDFAIDFWYTDGSKKDLGVAALSYASKVPNKTIRDASMTEKQQREINFAQGNLDEWDIEVHATGSPDPQDIRLKARSRSAANDNYAVFVDYLQKCDAGHTGQSAGRLNAEEASRTMAEIRTDFDCIAFGLAQFNRSADEADFPHYNMLKFSGQLEQDVNDLLVWHRPDFNEEGATAEDERYGLLNHQLSKHQAAGMGHMVEVDAALGTNTFQPWDPASVAREEKHGFSER